MVLTSSAFRGCQPIMYKWLSGDSGRCWPSAADEEWLFLEKALQHNGSPTQQGELCTEVSRLLFDHIRRSVYKSASELGTPL